MTLRAVADGVGFTVTTRYTGDPLHPLKLGVIVYVAVPDTFPVFTGASVMFPDPVAVTEAGLTGPEIALDHENVVPIIDAVGVNARAFALHICWLYEVTAFVMTGIGFTVAVTLNVGPGQPLAAGVMV